MSNNIRKFAIVLGVAALAAMLAGTATAFHGGGVAHCDGCHSMHNSADNPIETGATENGLLLKGSDPSSTCLNCHAGGGSDTSYHSMSTDASVQSAGGDFFWLTKSYISVVRGTTQAPSDSDNVGHNVVADDFTLAADVTNTNAPGGGPSSAALGCDSCHDPHGQVGAGLQMGTPGGQLPISVSGSYGDTPATGTIAGNYRLLRDWSATVAAPVALIVPNGRSKYGEADDHHVAYGQGMSEWCAGCHPNYIGDPNKHPAGNSEHLGLSKSANYNSYVQTGDFTGAAATANLSLVPFEIGTNDMTTLKDASLGVFATVGPGSSANVMCLSCHRAHASAFNNITRWDMETELLAESFPNANHLGQMGVIDLDAPYYGKKFDGSLGNFGAYQRSLCNKCHGQD